MDDEDRNDFISLIGEISNRFDVNVFAYVLMDNPLSYPASNKQAQSFKGNAVGGCNVHEAI